MSLKQKQDVFAKKYSQKRLLPYFDLEINLSNLTDAAAIFLTSCHLTAP